MASYAMEGAASLLLWIACLVPLCALHFLLALTGSTLLKAKCNMRGSLENTN